MCVIIDNNCAGSFFAPLSSNAALYEPLHKWIKSGKGKLVYGGTKWRAEVFKNSQVKNLVAEWKLAGKAAEIPDQLVDGAVAKFHGLAHKSDDEHILGLADISKSRLLVTADELLKQDFKNPTLLKPRGKIFAGKGKPNLVPCRQC